MKKNHIFRMLAILMLTLPVACVDELVPVQVDRPVAQVAVRDSMTICATMEQGLTKTSLGGDLSVVWNKNDQIRVYNANTPSGVVFTLDDACAGQVKGTFSGPALSGEGPFYAVYPASAGGSLSGDAVQVSFPYSQTEGRAGSFAPNSNISIGKADSAEEIYFQNVGGLLAVTLTGSRTVQAIAVTADVDECLSGTGQVTPSQTEGPSLQMGSGDNTVVLDLSSNPVALTSEEKTFYIVVPAGTLAGGFSVSLYDNAGNAMVKHASGNNSNRVARSAVRAMPTVNYAPEVAISWLAYDAGSSEGGLAGYFEGIDASGSGSTSSLLDWSEIDGQYAWNLPAEGQGQLRIQNWNAGYVLGITLESSELTVGKSYAAVIEAMGNAAGVINPGETTLKVVQKGEGRIWLSDGTKGYIMKMEED